MVVFKSGESTTMVRNSDITSVEIKKKVAKGVDVYIRMAALKMIAYANAKDESEARGIGVRILGGQDVELEVEGVSDN